MSLPVAMSGVTQAAADWRSDMGVFRIGIATNYEEPFKQSKFDLFASEISKALNMPVEIFQARDASALIDAMASSRIEYAIVSALGYATLEEFCACVTPLVAPVSSAGATSVRSILIVNPLVIKTLDDLPGKRIAVGPDTSLSGNLLPTYELKLGTKNFSDIGITRIESKNTENAIKQFMAGDVDAFFGWQETSATDKLMGPNILDLKLAQLPQAAAATLWVSTPIRFGPHVVRSNLPSEALSALNEALLDLEQTAPLAYDAISPDFAGGFKSVKKNDYKSAFGLVDAIVERSARNPRDIFDLGHQ
ncbi:MAG: PhnD/SsuA/transferrin family substrate-binding protein [Ahrensia sp.]|nr:PhnD/SsuA/transferrin family substrate-binding protein [Ahrensia sp.]